MKYTGRLITPEEFGDIVIRSTDNGEVLKLKDVADIQLGQDSYACLLYTSSAQSHSPYYIFEKFTGFHKSVFKKIR